EVAGRTDIDDCCIQSLVAKEPLRDGNVRRCHTRRFHNTDLHLTGGACDAHTAEASSQPRGTEYQPSRLKQESSSRLSPPRHHTDIAGRIRKHTLLPMNRKRRLNHHSATTAVPQAAPSLVAEGLVPVDGILRNSSLETSRHANSVDAPQ